MRCEVAREAMSARLDGERENVPSARVDEHLAGCAACTAYAAAVSALDAVGPDPAPDLADRILGAVREQPQPVSVPGRARWSRSRILWTSAAAAAALTGGLVVASVLRPASWVILLLLAAAFCLTCALTLAAGRDPRALRRSATERAPIDTESQGGEALSEVGDRDAVIVSIRRIEPNQELVESMATITVPVDGLHCNGCVETVTKDVSAIPGVQSVQIDLNTRGVSQVRIDADEDIADEVIDQAIRAHGNSIVTR